MSGEELPAPVLAKIKSSKDIPLVTEQVDNRTLAEVESMLRNISQRCGVAATPEWMKAEIDRVADRLRIWQR